MHFSRKKSLVLAIVSIFVAVFIFTADFFCVPPAFSSPARGEPVQIEADTITYNNNRGIAAAEGNVTITQGETIITALRAEYNLNAREGVMSGGVKAIMENASLTADEVRSYDNNERIFARGNVILIKGDNSLTGAEVEYRPAAQYAVSSSGRIVTKDAVMTANRMEAFFNEERAIGTGNARIVSNTRNIDATANKITYYGMPQENARIILTGNARVLDGVNLLTGEILTINLYDRAVEAQGGRPRLVFVPQ